MQSSQNSAEVCMYCCSAQVGLITGQGLRFVLQGQTLGPLGRALAQRWVHQHSMRENIITQKKHRLFLRASAPEIKKPKVTHPHWLCLNFTFPHVAVSFVSNFSVVKVPCGGEECCRWAVFSLRCVVYTRLLSLLGTWWRAHAHLSGLLFMFFLVVFQSGTEWADKTLEQSVITLCHSWWGYKRVNI